MTRGLFMQAYTLLETWFERFKWDRQNECSSLLCIVSRQMSRNKQFTFTPDFVSNSFYTFLSNIKWNLSNRRLRAWVDCADLSESLGWSRWSWSWKAVYNQNWRDRQYQLKRSFKTLLLRILSVGLGYNTIGNDGFVLSFFCLQ